MRRRKMMTVFTLQKRTKKVTTAIVCYHRKGMECFVNVVFIDFFFFLISPVQCVSFYPVSEFHVFIYHCNFMNEFTYIYFFSSAFGFTVTRIMNHRLPVTCSPHHGPQELADGHHHNPHGHQCIIASIMFLSAYYPQKTSFSCGMMDNSTLET